MTETNPNGHEEQVQRTYTWKLPVTITVEAGNNADSKESVEQHREKVEEAIRQMAREDHHEIVSFAVGMGERGTPMEVCPKGAERLARQTELALT